MYIVGWKGRFGDIYIRGTSPFATIKDAEEAIKKYKKNRRNKWK